MPFKKLIEAIRSNSLDACLKILENNPHLNLNKHYYQKDTKIYNENGYSISVPLGINQYMLADGLAPIHYAVLLGHTENLKEENLQNILPLLEAFLEHGAELSFETADGHNVFDLCADMPAENSIMILEFIFESMVSLGNYSIFYQNFARENTDNNYIDYIKTLDKTHPIIGEYFNSAFSRYMKLKQAISYSASLSTLPLNEPENGVACPSFLQAVITPNLGELIKIYMELGANIDYPYTAGTPILQAIASKQSASVEILLELKANIEIVSKEGHTLLMKAVIAQDERTVNLLLNDKYKLELDAVDQGGHTALSLSLLGTNIYITKALLEKGSRIQGPFGLRKETLLYIACIHRNLEAIDLLIKFKADPNEQGLVDGKTALHGAVTNSMHGIHSKVESHNMVELLLQHNAKCDVLDYAKVSPKRMAIIAGYPQSLKLLMQASSDLFNTDVMADMEDLNKLIRRNLNNHTTPQVNLECYRLLVINHLKMTLWSFIEKGLRDKKEAVEIFEIFSNALLKLEIDYSLEKQSVIISAKNLVCDQDKISSKILRMPQHQYLILDIAKLKSLIEKIKIIFNKKKDECTFEAIKKMLFNSCELKKFLDKNEASKQSQQTFAEVQRLETLNSTWLNQLKQLINIDVRLPHVVMTLSEIKEKMIKNIREAIDLLKNSEEFNIKALQGSKKIAALKELENFESIINTEYEKGLNIYQTLVNKYEEFCKLYSNISDRYKVQEKLNKGELQSAVTLLKPLNDLYFGKNGQSANAVESADKKEMADTESFPGFKAQLTLLLNQKARLEELDQSQADKTLKIFRANAIRKQLEQKEIDEANKIALERKQKDEELKQRLEKLQETQKKLEIEREERQRKYLENEKIRRAKYEAFQKRKKAEQQRAEVLALTFSFERTQHDPLSNQNHQGHNGKSHVSDKETKGNQDKPKQPAPITLEDVTQISHRLGVEEETQLLQYITQADLKSGANLKECMVERFAILSTLARMMDYAKQIKGNFIFPRTFARQFRNQIYHVINLFPQLTNDLSVAQALNANLRGLAKNMLEYYLKNKNNSLYNKLDETAILKELYSESNEILSKMMSLKIHDPQLQQCKNELNTHGEALTICYDMLDKELFPEPFIQAALKYSIARISTFYTHFRDHYQWDSEFELFHLQFKIFKAQGDKIRHVESRFEQQESIPATLLTLQPQEGDVNDDAVGDAADGPVPLLISTISRRV